MNLPATILNYFEKSEADPYHRYRSWEHCFKYFQDVGPIELREHRDDAAYRLGFYLASWGMYRGSCFLLQHCHRAHYEAIECLADPRWSKLWQTEFGSDASDVENISLMLDLRDRIGHAYAPFGTPTDTLATKILLGTVGCTPAMDRYFRLGFSGAGFPCNNFNRPFLERVLQFSQENLPALREVQNQISERVGTRYPLMKLVDMYFFQLGW